MSSRLIRRSMMSLAIASAIGLLVQTAEGVTHTWAASPVSDQMSNALNWVGGVPVSGSPNLTLNFGTTNYAASNQDIATPLELEAMNFSVPNSYFLYGNPFEFKN